MKSGKVLKTLWTVLWVCHAVKFAVGVQNSTSLKCYSCVNCAKVTGKPINCMDEIKDRIGKVENKISTNSSNEMFSARGYWSGARIEDITDALKCAKQDIYITAKYPPGSSAGKDTEDHWDEGRALEKAEPKYVSRFCALHPSSAHVGKGKIEVGGKFAVHLSLCQSDGCNTGTNGKYSKKDFILFSILFLLLPTFI